MRQCNKRKHCDAEDATNAMKKLKTSVKRMMLEEREAPRVTHRDLKPENLFLTKNEELKIGDFGLAAEFDKAKFLWAVCGTPGYVAPEVFSGKYRGEPADIWSCGIILFQLLTGETPWEDSTTRYPKFALWCSSTSEMRLRRSWRSLSDDHFLIVKKVLAPNAKYRATVSDIEKNSWFLG
ncbi:serine/threonine-protein kinase Chk1-like [Oratosquilla oratoria]|uniref:serine/threonine-protein kinase Chk1-like n=1 Tax=Oratosquilla oratoria TaxID=337810 RepID=UPI003F767553